jgi:hypothetical protein
MKRFRKLAVALVATLITSFMVTTPSLATTPAETGDIYYWGAWNDATQSFRGMHRYNLDTKTDEALGTGSPSCALAVGQPSALAVDPAHNKLYWSITDGNAGVFAMDLTTATCYSVSSDYPVTALEIIASTQTLIWSMNNGGINIASTDVSDLSNISIPNYQPVTIPNNTIYSISDLVLAEGKLFYMVYGDLGAGAMGQIYSTTLDSIGSNFTLERDTGLTPPPGQLVVTDADFYYNIISAQVVKVPRDGSGLVGYLDVTETAGFTVANGKMYTAKNRNGELKSIDLSQNDQVMTALPGGAIPDFNGKLRYSAVTQGGLDTPTITANNTVTAGGVALVPFSGVTIADNKKLQYTLTFPNNAPPVIGYCTISGSNCEIGGLLDTKRYSVQLKLVYTFQDGSNTISTVGSIPSNVATINGAASSGNYDPATCTATINDDPATTQPGNGSPIVLSDSGDEIGSLVPTYTRGFVDQGLNSDDALTRPIELPFSLTTATGHSTLQISTNGVANDNQTESTIDVFNADMDGIDGGILAGICSLNFNGVTKQAFFITWNNFKFYDHAGSKIDMQLILIKNSDWSYTAIRNYKELSTNSPAEITFGYMCPFVSNPAWCGRVVSDLPNSDVQIDVSPGAGRTLLSDGAYYLGAHHSLVTSQIGRYVSTVDSNPTLCDQQAGKTLTVSYSAPGVQGVDSSFENVVTEDFNSLPVGNVAVPYASNVGTITGTLTTFPANQFGGAGGTGNGAQVADILVTAPANTCYKYLGFWWSAGSPGNSIQLLSENDVVLANFTSEDLYRSLVTNGGNDPCPDATNGYCGNPSDPVNVTPGEPFAYVNLRFPAGFKKIRLYGTGFEIDNISLSVTKPAGGANETLLSGDPGALTEENPPTPPTTPDVLSGTIHGFKFERAKMLPRATREIGSLLTDVTGYTKVTCVGYTGFNWNKRTSYSLKRLAINRANNVCNYIHRLYPNIQIVKVRSVRERSKVSDTRRVRVTMTK